MEAHGAFLPLLIVVFLAFLVPLVFTRMKSVRVPVVVGEIIAGMIVGRSGLRLVADDDPLLTLLAQFGFVFLMFISGMEVDFSNLGRDHIKSPPGGKRETRPLALAGLVFAATLAMSVAIGGGLTLMELTKNPFIMALILSTTSLGVVVPVLKESGLSSGRYGQAILLSALIADFATMLLITVVVATLSHGLTLDLLLIGVLFVAFLLMYRFGFFFSRIPGVRRAIEELAHATTQIKVRAAFTVMLMFIVLAEALGTEIILGAFLAGVIVALIRMPDDVELTHKLEAIGFGFFIPIFFINVGINFDLRALLASRQALILVPLLMITAVVVKSVPALILKLNYSTRQALAAGALLSARLSLIIAVAEIGRELGLIQDSVNSAVILVAVTTVTLAPIAFLRLIPGRAAGRERLMVVVGLGDLGQRVAGELRAHYEHVAAVDNQAEHVARARQRGIDAIYASVELDDPAAAPLLDRAYALLCTYGDSELNYRACQVARTTYGIEHVVAHVSNPIDLPRFTQLGVIATNAAFDSAAVLVMLMRNRAAYQLLTRTDDDKEVFEVPVFSDQFIGKMLRQLALPGDVLILAIRRDGELLVPHGDTRLNANDYLTLIGSIEHVTTAQQLVSNGQITLPAGQGWSQ